MTNNHNSSRERTVHTGTAHTDRSHIHPKHEHTHYRRKYYKILISLILAVIVILTLGGMILRWGYIIKSQQEEIAELSKKNYEMAVSYPAYSTTSHISDLDINIKISEEDIIILSKMVYGEARGVKPHTVGAKYITNTEQMAACVWSVLNRVDTGYAASISEVVTAPNQYIGYSPNNPVKEEYVALVRDVLIRWQFEKVLDELGISSEVGRTLPTPEDDNLWCWFLASKNNSGNIFRSKYQNGVAYTWWLYSPYKNNI